MVSVARRLICWLYKMHYHQFEAATTAGQRNHYWQNYSLSGVDFVIWLVPIASGCFLAGNWFLIKWCCNCVMVRREKQSSPLKLVINSYSKFGKLSERTRSKCKNTYFVTHKKKKILHANFSNRLKNLPSNRIWNVVKKFQINEVIVFFPGHDYSPWLNTKFVSPQGIGHLRLFHSFNCKTNSHGSVTKNGLQTLLAFDLFLLVF